MGQSPSQQLEKKIFELEMVAMKCELEAGFLQGELQELKADATKRIHQGEHPKAKLILKAYCQKEKIVTCKMKRARQIESICNKLRLCILTNQFVTETETTNKILEKIGKILQPQQISKILSSFEKNLENITVANNTVEKSLDEQFEYDEVDIFSVEDKEINDLYEEICELNSLKLELPISQYQNQKGGIGIRKTQNLNLNLAPIDKKNVNNRE